MKDILNAIFEFLPKMFAWVGIFLTFILIGLLLLRFLIDYGIKY